MKSLQYFSSAFFIFTLLFMASCDKISGPYTVSNNNGDACPTPTFPALPANYYNKVLLEEYTGIKCVNCPGGSLVARNLKNIFGDTLLLMEVHCGDFAIPDASGDFTADYRTAAGDAFNLKFGMSDAGLPDGMVNRVGFPSSNHVLYQTAWGGAVATAKQKPVILALQIINNYLTTERKLCTHIKTTYRANMSKNLMLSVLMIEDSIISPQKNGDAGVGTTPTIIDYVHKHVLRDAVNSPWGVPIAVNTVASVKDSSIVKSYLYNVNPNWNDDRCSIYAIVYDADTYEIYQVEEQKLE